MQTILCEFLYLGSFDHTPVPDQSDSFGPKALYDLLDLRANSLWIAGVANKDLDGQWPTLVVAEQANNDLLFARFAVAIISPGGQGVVFTFQVTTGYVIEKEFRAVLVMEMIEELEFDLGLIFRQPCEIGIELILIEWLYAENIACRMGGGQAALQLS